jgi:hypothetical protein
MRPLGDSPPRSFEFEVLDGNDLPHSWLGRKVGVETVTAPGLLVGWLQSKSTWRLEIVDDRTGEPWYVPWVAVEAIFLFKEEPDAPGSPETVAEMSMEPEPTESRESPETSSEGAEPRSSTGGDQEPAERRREPWYKRWFG